MSWVRTCTYDRGPQEGRHRFFDDGEFAAVVLELLKDARRDLAQFLPLTGWRRDEGRLLQWAAVDREGETIRREEARSNGGKPRLVASSTTCVGRPRGTSAGRAWMRARS